jgi:hypothetical protein
MTPLKRLSYALAAAGLAVIAAVATSGTASAATTMPATRVLSGVHLQNFNVAQSLAYDPMYKEFVYAQLRQGYPASAGDLTLTLVDLTGRNRGHMYLSGFGHGVAISLERQGKALYVWTETAAKAEPAYPNSIASAFGTRLARFPWTYNATLKPTSAGVVQYAGGSTVHEVTPGLDAAHNQIGMHYYSSKTHRWNYIVYKLSDFRSHKYTTLAWFNEPAETGVSQGWTLYGSRIYRLDQVVGVRATITEMTLTGAVVATSTWPEASTVPDWEPEGITSASGNLCANVAGGPTSTNHTENTWCQRSLP